VTLITSSLQKNSSLTHLDIGHNFAKDKGATAVSQLITINKTLEVIKFKFSFITETGLLVLAQAIAGLSETKLKTLALANNPISQKVLEKFVAITKGSPIQTHLESRLKLFDTIAQERTVWISPLVASTTEQHVKKFFHATGCGAVDRVSIFSHSKSNPSTKPKRFSRQNELYCFVEFHSPDSTVRAIDLAAKKQAVINNHRVSIFKVSPKQK